MHNPQDVHSSRRDIQSVRAEEHHAESDFDSAQNSATPISLADGASCAPLTADRVMQEPIIIPQPLLP